MKTTVSIFEKRWIDLVFEGKNQEYGAYQLRQENSKTSVKAFLYGLTFIVAVSGFGMLMSSFNEVPKVPIVTFCPILHLDNIHPNELKPDKPIEPPVEEKSEKAPDETILKDPIVAKNPVENIIKNDNLPKTPTTETGTGTTGITTTLPITAGGTDTGEGKKPFTGIATTGVLDVQPDFPGGMEKFYSFVAKNFEKPDDVEGSVRIIVSFVIEPDGTMTNIVVAKNADSSMAEEAIRVLKSLKTKWKAGVIDGEKVRTSFSLPIVIKS